MATFIARAFHDDDVFLIPSYASYAKAGSFVQQLREIDDDPKKLVAFYRDCRVVWVGDTPKTPQGKLLDAAELTQMIDTALQAHYASSWSSEQWAEPAFQRGR